MYNSYVGPIHSCCSSKYWFTPLFLHNTLQETLGHSTCTTCTHIHPHLAFKHFYTIMWHKFEQPLAICVSTQIILLLSKQSKSPILWEEGKRKHNIKWKHGKENTPKHRTSQSHHNEWGREGIERDIGQVKCS